MSREMDLQNRLDALQAQRKGAALLSAQAVVADDAKAITGARKALREIDDEIEELTNALPLAKQKDQADHEQAQRAKGIQAAALALPIAKRKLALAQQIDKDIASLASCLKKMYGLGVQLAGPVQDASRVLGGIDKVAFNPRLPADLFILLLADTTGCFTDSPFSARGEDRAAELRGRRLPWASVQEWGSSAVDELEQALQRAGHTEPKAEA